MIRQYHAHRFQGGPNPLHVGIIPAGAIFYIQDEGWWRDRFRGRPTCREPWIVESFLNGIVAAAKRDPSSGKWLDTYAARRSDMAVIRSLRTGSRRSIAVRTKILHEDLGLRLDGATYPDLPAFPYCNRMPSQRLTCRAA
jgi:hypothetical protein